MHKEQKPAFVQTMTNSNSNNNSERGEKQNGFSYTEAPNKVQKLREFERKH